MGNVYTGIATADLHCGAYEAIRWHTEMNDLILDYAESLEILDFFIIAGDFHDQKLSLNSDHAKYGLGFLSRLINIAKAKKSPTKIRIVQGTESHDNKQLEVLDALFKNSGIDFKIIIKVEEEWLFEDMKVLYIPEEYMKDKDEYYKPFFENAAYDMVFGHGLINEALPFAVKQESEATMSRAPVFTKEELFSICKGPIFFGHVHTNLVIDNKFFYTNSPSRWSYGEEEDKGFYSVIYTPETAQYKTDFVVNKKAKRFDTVEVICEPNRSPKDQVEFLLQLAETLIIDKLRISVTIPENHDNPVLLTSMINDVFTRHKNINIKLINTAKKRREQEIEKKVEQFMVEYGYIFDKKLSTEEKLFNFVKHEYGRNIPVERIRRLLYDGITKGELSVDIKD